MISPRFRVHPLITSREIPPILNDLWAVNKKQPIDSIIKPNTTKIEKGNTTHRTTARNILHLLFQFQILRISLCLFLSRDNKTKRSQKWWMAKTNKYASINFNHIYEKSPSTNPNHSSNNNTKPTKNSSSSSSSSPSYSAISSPKTHGRMLVLTRPTPTPSPKPATIPPPQPLSPQPQPQRSHQIPGQTPSESGSDHISLRPLGHTGTSSPVLSSVPSLEKEKQVVNPVLSPKPGKFVPPHLRPGFVGREERSVPEFGRGRDSGRNNFGSPVKYGEDGRPKSGGGYDRMREGESDLGMVIRPRSSGNRPSSSGWYGPLHISPLFFGS
jgi:hypothetical protein